MSLIQNLVARLTLDSTQFDSAAKRSSKSMKDLTAESLALQKRVVAVSAAYVAVRAAIAAFSQVAQAAARAQQSDIIFRRSMGEMSAAATRSAEVLARQYGDSADAMQDMIAEGNALARTIGLDAEQSFAMAQGLTELSYKFAAFRGLEPAAAFSALEAALSGSGKALKRYGIEVDDAAVKSWALSRGCIKQGQDLNQVGETMARYRIIQEKVNEAASRTADGTVSLNEGWRRLTGTIKDGVKPALRDLADDMGLVVSAGQKLASVLSDVIQFANKYGMIWTRTSMLVNVGRMADTNDHSPVTDPAAPAGSGRGPYADWARILEANQDRYGIVPAPAAPPAAPANEPPPPGITKPGTETDAAKTTRDILALYTRMYDQIDTRDSGSFRVKQILLDLESEEVKKTLEKEIDDYRKSHAAIDEGNAEQFARMQALLADWEKLWAKWKAARERALAWETAEGGDDFFAGFNARMEKMKEGLWTVGKAGAESAQMVRDGFADAWTESLFKGRDFAEQVKALLLDIGAENFRQMWARPVMQQGVNWGGTVLQYLGNSLVNSFGNGAGSTPVDTGTANGPSAMPAGQNPTVNPYVGHAGGRAGYGSFPVRHESLALWRGAPRLHDGLRPDEFRFIGQRGERITSKQGVAAEGKAYGEMVALLKVIAAKEMSTNVAVVRSQEEIVNTLRTRGGRRAIAEVMAEGR